jgi:hypothetical protein
MLALRCSGPRATGLDEENQRAQSQIGYANTVGSSEYDRQASS